MAKWILHNKAAFNLSVQNCSLNIDDKTKQWLLALHFGFVACSIISQITFIFDLRHRLRKRRKVTFLSDFPTPKIKPHWNGYKDSGNASQESTGPVDTHTIEHVCCEKW